MSDQTEIPKPTFPATIRHFIVEYGLNWSKFTERHTYGYGAHRHGGHTYGALEF